MRKRYDRCESRDENENRCRRKGGHTDEHCWWGKNTPGGSDVLTYWATPEGGE